MAARLATPQGWGGVLNNLCGTVGEKMIFSIYLLRADPDFAIFDREIGNPEIGYPNDYDCAGVFEVEVGASVYWRQDGSCVLGDFDDEWGLNAQSVLCGDFTDKDSGNTAKITQLWPVSGASS